MTRQSRLAAVAAILLTVAPLTSSAQSTTARKGTEIDTTLAQTLSSKTAQDGATFQLTEKEGFFHHAPAILKGATFEGHVSDVTRATSTHKATMTLNFDDVKLADGTTRPIGVALESLSTVQPHTHHIRDLGLVVGGAVAGHMAGNHMGKKHGGLAGAAAGFALANGLKSDIVLKAGTLVKLKLTEDFSAQGG